MKKLLLMISAALLWLAVPNIAWAAQTLLTDNFDSSPTGGLPTGWSKATTNAVTSITVVDGTPAGNKWVRFHDDNGANTSNNQLYRSFTAVTSGLVVAQFDVNLAQTTAGFGTRLCSGTPVTSGQYWATGLIFEGKIAYASSGASPGTLTYQTDSIPTYRVTPLSRQYAANTWYTIRVIANVTTKTYKLFVGPRGGDLTEITPAGGVTFPNTASGHTVTQINYISFFSSNRNGDDPGDLLIDNVSVYSDSETTVSSASIAEARLLAKGTRTALGNKVVTFGTSGGVFYMQDDDRTAGIRVRALSPAVHEGDRVDVVGRIAQTSEGTPSDHLGEREIVAEQITIRSSGNLVPKPLVIRDMHITGGWFGPMELVADGYEPVQKAVWPYNSWGDAGITVWLANDHLLPPVNTAGMLVTAFGKVTETTTYDWPGTNYDFYLTDGSIKNDGWFSTAQYQDEAFRPVGLRVRITDPSILSGILPLHYGDVLKVTGIAGAIACTDLGRSSGRNVRVIRPRKPEDIEVIWRQPRYVKFDIQGNCLVGGRPFFPIGIFIYAWDSLVRPEVLSKGFNTVIYAVTPNDLPQLQSDGLMTIPYGTDQWLAVKDHPSILAWYLDDEPEGHGISPKTEREYYERVRKADPTRPIGTAHFLWDSLYNFRFCDDYTMSDVYPLHRMNIWSMTDHIDRLHQIHGQGFPVWPAIQCFGGTEGYDIPSPTEVRAMTYMALAHNSKGILYFSYYPSIPDAWAEVGRLVGELKQLMPFYCLPSSEPGIGNTNGWVHARLIRNGDSGLLITVNVSGSAQSATFTIPSPAPDTLNLPIEGGSIPVTSGQFSASFDPLAVHVYQWGPTPQADLFTP